MHLHPFKIEAIVVLPDHLHLLMQLPNEDDDFSIRWKLIKQDFNKAIREKSWQKRFWEHLIRDENDWRMHMDYIHYNPVKHGYAVSPKDWQHSSFHKFVRAGYYNENWGSDIAYDVEQMDFE